MIQGFDCGHDSANWTCGYHGDQYITYVDGVGIPSAEQSNLPSVMNWEYPSTMYRTFISRYDSNSQILFNAQQVMCQGNNTGSLLEYAIDNMYDFSMIDDIALQEDCNSNELQQEGVH